METMIAYCGLDCVSCPILLATVEPDKSIKQAMRESIARQCSEYYGMNIKPEDVDDCDGCQSDSGKIFSGCLKCEIRKCAIGKHVESCAYCSDYACEKLRNHFSLDPGAQGRLEKLRG